MYSEVETGIVHIIREIAHLQYSDAKGQSCISEFELDGYASYVTHTAISCCMPYSLVWYILSHDIVCSKVFTSSSIQYVELCFSAGMLCCHVDDFIVSMMAFPYSVSVTNYAYTHTHTYMHCHT